MKYRAFYTDRSRTFFEDLTHEELFQNGITVVTCGTLITVRNKKRCVLNVEVKRDGVVEFTIN